MVQPPPYLLIALQQMIVCYDMFSEQQERAQRMGRQMRNWRSQLATMDQSDWGIVFRWDNRTQSMVRK